MPAVTGEVPDGLNALMAGILVDVPVQSKENPLPPALPVEDVGAEVQMATGVAPVVNDAAAVPLVVSNTVAGAVAGMPQDVQAGCTASAFSVQGQHTPLPGKQVKAAETEHAGLMLPDTRKAEHKREHDAPPALQAAVTCKKQQSDMPVAPLSGEHAVTAATEIKNPEHFAQDDAMAVNSALSSPTGTDRHIQGQNVTTTGSLEPTLGTPAWQQALGHQVSLFTRNGIQNAELRLHPEELGALQINLRLNNDQAQLHFITGNHQVRAALEAAMPHLRSLLDESGISLGQSTVSADTSSWQNASRQQEHGQPSDQGHRGQHDLPGDSEPAVTEAENVSSVRVSMLPDGINTYA